MPEIDLETTQEQVLGGTLYIVATPIGNLADLSDRARMVLSQVDLIAAEDTRQTRQLLAGFSYRAKLQSYHDFSKHDDVERLLTRLKSGDSMALVSDAGTPLISDPGFKLVKLAREQNIAVLPIPGACALTAALSVAGLPTDRFVFEGFLPNKPKARLEHLQSLQFEQRSLVFYESPRRIAASLQAMEQAYGGQRLVFLAREMTKKFEEHFLGELERCKAWLEASEHREKGEYVIVLSGADKNEQRQHIHRQGLHWVSELRPHMSLKKAVTLAANITGASKNELYSSALEDAAGEDDASGEI